MHLRFEFCGFGLMTNTLLTLFCILQKTPIRNTRRKDKIKANEEKPAYETKHSLDCINGRNKIINGRNKMN